MKTKQMFVTLSLIVILALIGCSTRQANSDNSPDSNAAAKSSSTGATSSKQQPYLTFKDDAGQDVILNRKPERVVILNTEALDLFYQLGGKAVGRASAPGTPVPDAAKEAEDVGQINQVSLEKITSLKPDLVIGQSFFHAKLKDVLAVSQIPLALMKVESYDDIQKMGKLFGTIIGNEPETERALKQTDDRIQSIISKVPNQSPKFAMITIMSMGISIQKSNNLALDIASKLKMKNVAEGMPSGQTPSSVPYSIEKLIVADPDYLFMIVHGTEEYGRQKLKDDLENNPAWASLRAVKDKKMIFLPSDFVNSPGLKIDQTFEYLPKQVYPNAYGK
ncbi:ABC transporter substrate-binding protein [Paenibacillus sp. RC67]|uniref:ABC transporter substrate-binding protein n=1 Tax=Paenibacillus sp. RC67 TaxID=3039392 RepID=UPI0024AD1A9A|nr:ABC transporter substrate-binding protein [Paenibacillus sp. RC67]